MGTKAGRQWLETVRNGGRLHWMPRPTIDCSVTEREREGRGGGGGEDRLQYMEKYSSTQELGLYVNALQNSNTNLQ
jgi:hypothetical protein